MTIRTPRAKARPSLAARARHPWPRRPEQRPGFTLLELVLVMAILCIAMAMVAPSLRGFGRGRGAGDCAAQLVALGGWARTQAISRGVVYRLNLDPATRTYWLTVQRENATEFLGEEFGRTFTAPDGVAIDWDVLEREDGRYVAFHPSGRTDPATIQLTDADGTVIEIACLSATELFRVVPAGTAAAEAASRAARVMP